MKAIEKTNDKEIEGYKVGDAKPTLSMVCKFQQLGVHYILVKLCR